MSDNNPNQPKPGEPAKVQPKKETVRINLPPKPSAAPTIKLPTLPPGGPAAGGFQTSSAPAAALPPAAPVQSVRPASPGGVAQAPGSQPRPQAPRPSAPVVAAISGLDIGLGIAAMLAGLLAVGSTVYCMSLFN